LLINPLLGAADQEVDQQEEEEARGESQMQAQVPPAHPNFMLVSLPQVPSVGDVNDCDSDVTCFDESELLFSNFTPDFSI